MTTKFKFLSFYLAFMGLNVLRAEEKILDLDRERLTLSSREDQDENKAAMEILVRRTAKSPEFVRLEMNYLEYDRVCLAYDSREVWIPPRTETQCRTVERGGGTERVCRDKPNGETVCADREVPGRSETICSEYEVPGHYETQTFCVEHGLSGDKTDSLIRLNFRRANQLKDNEEEIFKLKIEQKDLLSSGLRYTAEPVKVVKDYKKIDKSRFYLFMKQLKFIAQ